jgi:hypothetical protein
MKHLPSYMTYSVPAAPPTVARAHNHGKNLEHDFESNLDKYPWKNSGILFTTSKNAS